MKLGTWQREKLARWMLLVIFVIKPHTIPVLVPLGPRCLNFPRLAAVPSVIVHIFTCCLIDT